MGLECMAVILRPVGINGYGLNFLTLLCVVRVLSSWLMLFTEACHDAPKSFGIYGGNWEQGGWKVLWVANCVVISHSL